MGSTLHAYPQVEAINGLYKAEVIHRLGPWKNMESVEWQTLKWVDWYNNRRLLEPIGNIPPAEAEEKYYAQKADLYQRHLTLTDMGPPIDVMVSGCAMSLFQASHKSQLARKYCQIFSTGFSSGARDGSRIFGTLAPRPPKAA